jgi:hypothetical protein
MQLKPGDLREWLLGWWVGLVELMPSSCHRCNLFPPRSLFPPIARGLVLVCSGFSWLCCYRYIKKVHTPNVIFYTKLFTHKKIHAQLFKMCPLKHLYTALGLCTTTGYIGNIKFGYNLHLYFRYGPLLLLVHTAPFGG